jgi:hypothetical protein
MKPIELQGDVAHVESHLNVRSVTVLVWEQVRCTVYAKRTIGLEIVLDAPDGTPSSRGSSGSSLRSIWR